MHRFAAVAALCTIAVAGCRDQDPDDFPVTADREPREQLATAADTANGLGGDEGMSVITIQGGAIVGGPLTATGQLRSPDGASPPGAVTLTEESGTTRILLTIHGYQAGSNLQAVIARGACGEAGESVVVVEPAVTVPAEGVAELDARVERPMEPFFDGLHSLRLLSPEDATSGTISAGAAHACADLHRTA